MSEKRRFVNTVKAAAAIGLLAGQFAPVIPVLAKGSEATSSLTSSETLPTKHHKIKRAHGSLKIPGPVVESTQVSSSQGFSQRSTPNRSGIRENTGRNHSGKNQANRSISLRIGNDSNLKQAISGTLNLSKPIDIDREIEREKEKEALYKMIALIEKVAPDEAVKLIKQFSSERVSITSLENQAKKIVNDNVANLISIVPLEDLAKIGQLDFQSISQDSPLTTVVADFEGLVDDNLKPEIDLVADEITKILDNHKFHQTNWGEWGKDLLEGLGLAGASLAIFTQMMHYIPGIISTIQQGLQEENGKKKIPTKYLVAGALFTLACLGIFGPIIATTTPHSPDSPTPVAISSPATEVLTSPTAMPQAEVVKINNFIVDLANNTPGLAISSENPNLTEADKSLVMQYQNAPDLMMAINGPTVVGFDKKLTTEIFNAQAPDGTNFQAALTKIAYIQNGSETGFTVFYQFKDQNGNVNSYNLQVQSTINTDDETIIVFDALPTNPLQGGALLNLIIAQFDKDNNPIAVGFKVINSYNSDFAVLILFGQVEQIQQMMVAAKVNAMVLAPTETAPVLKLDKPITEKYDPYNLEAIPTINEAENHEVSSGLLQSTVMEHWKKQGLINADGSVNLPPGVIPTNPEDWQIFITNSKFSQGRIQLHWTEIDLFYSKYNADNAPFQRSNEVFRVGEYGILVTEKLFYYDAQGAVRVTPVFFYVDMRLSGYERYMYYNFGQIDSAPEGFIFSHGNDISLPGLGHNPPIPEQDLSNFVYMEEFLGEPMQAKRDQIIKDVENGNFDPADLGKVWVIAVPVGYL